VAIPDADPVHQKEQVLLLDLLKLQSTLGPLGAEELHWGEVFSPEAPAR
jgi:hypothetical protein